MQMAPGLSSFVGVISHRGGFKANSIALPLDYRSF
jgi:hypothetical protein